MFKINSLDSSLLINKHSKPYNAVLKHFLYIRSSFIDFRYNFLIVYHEKNINLLVSDTE